MCQLPHLHPGSRQRAGLGPSAPSTIHCPPSFSKLRKGESPCPAGRMDRYRHRSSGWFTKPSSFTKNSFAVSFHCRGARTSSKAGFVAFRISSLRNPMSLSSLLLISAGDFTKIRVGSSVGLHESRFHVRTPKLPPPMDCPHHQGDVTQATQGRRLFHKVLGQDVLVAESL